MKFLTAVSLFLLPTSTVALSGGAGNCAVGRSSVGHPSPDIIAWADSGLDLKIGGTSVSVGEAFEVTADEEVSIEVSGTSDFRGALLVVQSGDLAPGDLLRDASDTCGGSGLVGITHTSNALKSSVAGTLTPDSGTTTVDVNIVQVNRGGGQSSYTYQQFSLSVISAAAPDTPAPVAATPAATDAPVAAPPAGDEPTSGSGYLVGTSWLSAAVASVMMGFFVAI